MAVFQKISPVGEAIAQLQVGDVSPITIIGTPAIRGSFDEKTLQQVINARLAPGVTDVVLNPDAHQGYGAPIGCVMASPTHIYPGPVGVDIKCSMSLLQFDLPAQQIADKKTRRALIEAICQRVPTGAGQDSRSLKKGRHIREDVALLAAIEGASPAVCKQLGIPPHWAQRCEDAFHLGHDNTRDALALRLEKLVRDNSIQNLDDKIAQLGSYGGGNHFGEAEAVTVEPGVENRRVADVFGLKDGCVAFLSHCGSRGFGYQLASGAFKRMQTHFVKEGIPYPGGDRDLVYAELGTAMANDYLDDMALGANFATVNHMLINALVWEAFREVFPGIRAELVYFISHNIARLEEVDGKKAWVHRKGATRAFPANHPALANTPFAETGHPILLPGNPKQGSVVMVADSGAKRSLFSVNHGAGRALGRRAAIKTLSQRDIDAEFARRDILTNCRCYPRDEAPAAYKDFREVLKSVELAGLARPVARLDARFVIKDANKADD